MFDSLGGKIFAGIMLIIIFGSALFERGKRSIGKKFKDKDKE